MKRVGAAVGALVVGAIGCSAAAPAPDAPAAPVVAPSRTCVGVQQHEANIAKLLDEGHILLATRALQKLEPECRARLGTTWIRSAEALADLRRFEQARENAQAIAASSLAAADKQRARALETRVARAAAKSPAAPSRALQLYDAALATERAGKLAKAAALYLQSWESLQPNGPALLGAARVARGQGNTSDARRLFDRTLAEFEAETGEPMRPVRRPVAEPSQYGPLAFNRGDQLLLFANASAVEVWDVALGTTLYQINCQDSRPLARFSPDGRSLALGPVRGQNDIELRHAAGGYLLRRLDGHVDSLEHLEFFDDGKVLVSADFSGLVLVRETATGKELARFDFGTDVDLLLSAPTRDAVLVANNRDDVVALYELRTGRRIWRQQVAPQHVQAISPDGTVFAMASAEPQDAEGANTLTIADISTGEPVQVVPLPEAETYDVTFVSNDHLLARVKDGKGAYRFEVWTRTSAEPIASVATKTAPDFRSLPGERVAVWLDGELSTLDLRDNRIRPTSIRDRYATSAWASDWAVGNSSGIVAWVPVPGRARLQPLAGGSPRQLPFDAVVHARSLASIDGQSLAVADDRGVRRCDAKTERCERWLDLGLAPQQILVASGKPILVAVADDRVLVFDWVQHRVVARSPAIDGLRSATLSGNGARFATLTYDGEIAVFDASDGSLIAEVVGSPGNGPTIALDYDGEVLAATDENMNGRVVTLATRQARQLTEEVQAETAAFSADGRLVAFAFSAVSAEDSGDVDMTEVQVFDRTSGERRAAFRVQGLFGQELAFSPDQRFLAVNAGMGPTSLVEVGSGRVVATLDDAESLTFSEDGAWVAGIRYDGNLGFYDGRSGRPLLDLSLSSTADSAVVLAPNGRFELIGSGPLSPLDCATGSLALPAEVCRDAYETPGLLAATLRVGTVEVQ